MREPALELLDIVVPRLPSAPADCQRRRATGIDLAVVWPLVTEFKPGEVALKGRSAIAAQDETCSSANRDEGTNTGISVIDSIIGVLMNLS